MVDVNGYTTVRLPDFLIERIDIIVKNKNHGFRSRNEFCVYAVREILKKYNGSNNQSKGGDEDNRKH